MARVSPQGTLFATCLAADPSGGNSLKLETGTVVSNVLGEVPKNLAMRVIDVSPGTPEGIEVISPIYEIVGYNYSIDTYPVSFSAPVRLTLAYDAGQIIAGRRI